MDSVKIGKRYSDSFVNLTANGRKEIIVRAGEEFYSDAVDLPVTAKDDFVISIYIKTKTEITGACSNLSARVWHSMYEKDGSIPKTALETFANYKSYPNPNTIAVGIRRLEVLSDHPVNNMMLFGDSITHMSYYSDALFEHFRDAMPNEVAMQNSGIAGNRIVNRPTFAPHIPGHGSIYGDAALKRFEKDCFSFGTPDDIIFLGGTNDMIFPEWFEREEETVTPENLKKAIETFVRLSHDKGSRFWLGTVTPFQSPESAVCPNGEILKLEFNTWIRKQKIADGFIDFDRILRDESRANTLKTGVHIGDFIHPN